MDQIKAAAEARRFIPSIRPNSALQKGTITLARGVAQMQREVLITLGGELHAEVFASTTSSGYGLGMGAADTITKAISLSAFDWVVSSAEQARVVSVLDASPDPTSAILQLHREGALSALISRVSDDRHRAPLLQILGSRLHATARDLIRKELGSYTGRHGADFAYLSPWQMFLISEKLQEHPFAGFPSQTRGCGAPLFNTSPSSSRPFTGSGATGHAVNSAPTIPLADQWRLLRDDGATMARYKGPSYSADLTALLKRMGQTALVEQARSLIAMCINSRFPYVYANRVPSRGDIMRAAARRYRLDPGLVGAIILVEQWDQSRNEDAADYQGALSMVGKNSSIGLGQIVVSTAKKENLFSDLVPSAVSGALVHDQIAALLSSDEFNIFAVAKFLRSVADKGALQDINAPSTRRTVKSFPGIDMAAYSGHSASWPSANVAAIASEYTSAQWDGRFVFLWSELMTVAYRYIKRNGIL